MDYKSILETKLYSLEFVTENQNLVNTLNAIISEYETAAKNWPAFNSAHEGMSILQEEIFELQAHVYKNQKKRDIPEMRKEAIQVAAMALRFAIDVCNEERGRV